MVRREFLKLAGMVSAIGLVWTTPLIKVLSVPVEVESLGKLYRGTQDGKILVSANAGKSWQLHTDFGSELPILGLTKDRRENVQAQLGCAGYSFQLSLTPNSKIWKTA